MSTPASRPSLSMDTTGRLFRDLAYLAEGGLTAAEAVDVLLENGDAGSATAILGELQRNLSRQPSLATALENGPVTFGAETLALLRAGETRNALGGALTMLADDFERRLQMRKSLPAMLLWPATLLVFLSIITAVLLIFVVPAFKQVFSSFGADLPGLTLLVMSVSEFLVQYWIIGVVLVGGLVFGIAWMRRRTDAGAKIDAVFARLPGIHRFFTKLLAARAAALLSGAAAADIPFSAAIAYLRSTLRNRYLKSQLSGLEADLVKGVSFSSAWRKQTLLPRGIAQLVDIGNRSGRLSQALARAAYMHGVEAEDAVSIFRHTLLTVTYILTGLMVGITVIAMYLPIFKLGSVV